MTNSMFLAQIAGPLFLLGGLGILLNTRSFLATVTELMKSKALLFVMGFFMFIVGALVVSVHNVWIWDWTVIITLLGWIILIKAATMLLFPKLMDKIAGYFLKPAYITFGGVAWIILGATLCYMVWM